MPNLVLLCTAYGLVFGLMNDKMPAPIARLLHAVGFIDRMLKCSYCTGFHAGWMVWVVRCVVVGGPSTLLAASASLLAWAFASAAFCYAADTGLRWVEASTAVVEASDA